MSNYITRLPSDIIVTTDILRVFLEHKGFIAPSIRVCSVSKGVFDVALYLNESGDTRPFLRRYGSYSVLDQLAKEEGINVIFDIRISQFS